MTDLIKILENNGYGYYICQMVINYGKGDDRSERMECDYVGEIGGEVDYVKGFSRILARLGIKMTKPDGARDKLIKIIEHCSFHNPEILADRILAEIPKLCVVDEMKIAILINGLFGGSDTILLVQYGSTVSDLAKAITQADVIKLKE